MITRVAESPVFTRKGDNLEVEVPITIPEAIRGATIEVPTLSGSKRIRVPPGTQHGTVQRLRNEGPPRLGGRGRGDIHYRLVVDVPSSLSREQPEVVDELATVMDGNPRERLLSPRKGWPMGRGRRREPRRLHDLGGGRARRDASADAAHLRVARADHAQALAQEHPPVSQEDVERLRRIQELTGELG